MFMKVKIDASEAVGAVDREAGGIILAYLRVLSITVDGGVATAKIRAFRPEDFIINGEYVRDYEVEFPAPEDAPVLSAKEHPWAKAALAALKNSGQITGGISI